MKKLQLLFLFFCALILTACSKKEVSSSSTQTAQERSADAAAAATDANNNVNSDERLGTKWGDDIRSDVTQVSLKRVSNTPVAEALLRYANKDFQGRQVNSISLDAGKISFSVVDDRSVPIAMYRVKQNYYLAGQDGQSYQLQYQNHSGNTYEVVSSVDGVDVLDGSTASRSNSGYVLKPYETLRIEGFRKSDSAVASFTFSQPKEAYAANSDSGSIQNTGIIGTVIYELEAPKQKQRSSSQYAPAPNAFPADR